MARRGQGAMEYLMSYGWAVLVVLVIGVTVWQLGLLDFGASNPPTSTGFQSLKPLLPSCEDYARMDYAGDHDGFVCQFANNAGAPVMLKRIDHRVNGRFCEWTDTSVIKRFDANPHQIMTWWVQTADGPQFPSPVVYDMPGWTVSCADVSAPECGLTVPPDAAFFIAVGCCTVWKAGGGADSPCCNLESGEFYVVDLDIEYVIDVGGVPATKHSVGTIRIMSRHDSSV